MQQLMGADSSKLALQEEQNNMLDMISLRFDENKIYEIGDYCLYFNGVYDGLYRFKSEKGTGVWDPGSVESIRLSDVLNKTYAKLLHNANMSIDSPEMIMKYTGVNLTLPANHICFIKASVYWNNNPPVEAIVNTSPINQSETIFIASNSTSLDKILHCYGFFEAIVDSPIYLWATWSSAGINSANMSAYCIPVERQ